MQPPSNVLFTDPLKLTTIGLALIVGLITGAFAAHTDGLPLLIVAAVGLITLGGIIMRPTWGLILLVFITYIRLSDILVHEHSLPSLAKPFIGFLLLVIITHCKWGTMRLVGVTRGAIILLSYGLAALLSLFAAIDIPLAQDILSIYAKDALIALLVILLCQQMAHFRQIVWALLAAGICLGTLSVHQQLTGAFYHNYGGFSQAAVQHITGKINDYRLAGPIGDPNFYAQILLVIIPLAFNRLWYETKSVARTLAFWSLGVCSFALVCTFSRGAILALGVMAALHFWRRPPRPVSLLIGLLALVLLFYFLPAKYTSRIQSLGTAAASITGNGQHDEAMKGRLSENLVGWQMWADHPWIGVGIGHYPLYYRKYAKQIGMDLRHEDRSAHNLYLQIASETGLVGLSIFGLLLGIGYRGMYVSYLRLNSQGRVGEAEMIISLLLGLTGYLVAAFFLHAAFARYFWLLYGIVLAIPNTVQHQLSAESDAASAQPIERSTRITPSEPLIHKVQV